MDSGIVVTARKFTSPLWIKIRKGIIFLCTKCETPQGAGIGGDMGKIHAHDGKYFPKIPIDRDDAFPMQPG